MDIKNHTKPIREFAEQLIDLMDEFEAQLEPNIEVGQYWKWDDEHGGEVVRIDSVSDHIVAYTYLSGRSSDFGKEVLKEHATLLSDSEVGQALIEEAERRGFKTGEKIYNNNLYSHDSSSNDYIISITPSYKYNKEKDYLDVRTNICRATVYKQGNWAEIITDEWEIEETPYLRIRKGGLVINCEHETEPEEGFERREAEAIRDALNDMEQSC